ncbi:MAG: hypothetical protein CMP23_08880 [Rickettsiales bacterium]|nr:hypothetical protein [Rickettsiales bacterium]
MPPEARIVLDAGNLLGEGPIWDHQSQSLFWVDIHGRAIECYQPEGSVHRRWQLPVRPSALARCADGASLLVAAEHGLGFFTPSTGQWSPWLQLEAPDQLPMNRTNDGRCDPQGRFWIGTMHDEVAERSGSLYRVEASGAVAVQLQGLGIPNTLAWSKDSFYFGDSLDQMVRRYPLGQDLNTESSQPLFALPAGDACPDGSAIDAQGRLWTCIWDGARIDCHGPDGSLLQSIKLPVQRPTSCTFGGPDLDCLFITSSGRDLPGPNGALLALDGLATGLPEPTFG